jgi:hypothetical protein
MAESIRGKADEARFIVCTHVDPVRRDYFARSTEGDDLPPLLPSLHPSIKPPAAACLPIAPDGL